MEEFIDNFTEFRDWLYNLYETEGSSDPNEGYGYAISEICKKFEELGLHEAF